MAYGVDTPTEVGYEYRKPKVDPSKQQQNEYDGLPNLSKVIWETSGGLLEEEHYTTNMVDEKKGHPSQQRGGILPFRSKLKPFKDGSLSHSGDGTVPYLSLSWAHTWLLHAIRAKRFSNQEDNNNHNNNKEEGRQQLRSIGQHTNVEVSYRPQDEMEWKPGHPPRTTIVRPWDEKQQQQENADSSSSSTPDGVDHHHNNKTSHYLTFSDKEKLARIKHVGADTGTSHPHGTKYKPEMVKFHNIGISRKQSNMEYSTTVIEAAGVEHKETTRNYDILAAVFGEILIHMHDDFGLV